MQGNVLSGSLEELGYVGLGQPNHFALKPNLDARFSIFCLIDQEFGLESFLGENWSWLVHYFLHHEILENGFHGVFPFVF
jgi:hypothetical protein